MSQAADENKEADQLLSGHDDLVLEDLEKELAAQLNDRRCCSCDCSTRGVLSHFVAFLLGVLSVLGYLTSYHTDLGFWDVFNQTLHQDTPVRAFTLSFAMVGL